MRPLETDRLEANDPNNHEVGAVHKVWGWATILKYAEQAAARRDETAHGSRMFKA